LIYLKFYHSKIDLITCCSKIHGNTCELNFWSWHYHPIMGLIQNMEAMFQTWKNIVFKNDLHLRLIGSFYCECTHMQSQYFTLCASFFKTRVCIVMCRGWQGEHLLERFIFFFLYYVMFLLMQSFYISYVTMFWLTNNNTIYFIFSYSSLILITLCFSFLCF
jgi:hypothetical protein